MAGAAGSCEGCAEQPDGQLPIPLRGNTQLSGMQQMQAAAHLVRSSCSFSACRPQASAARRCSAAAASAALRASAACCSAATSRRFSCPSAACSCSLSALSSVSARRHSSLAADRIASASPRASLTMPSATASAPDLTRRSASASSCCAAASRCSVALASPSRCFKWASRCRVGGRVAGSRGLSSCLSASRPQMHDVAATALVAATAAAAPQSHQLRLNTTSRTTHLLQLCQAERLC